MSRFDAMFLLALLVTFGCGKAPSTNQSPIATEEERIQSQEDAAKREAVDKANEAEFFRNRANRPK